MEPGNVNASVECPLCGWKFAADQFMLRHFLNLHDVLKIGQRKIVVARFRGVIDDVTCFCDPIKGYTLSQWFQHIRSHGGLEAHILENLFTRSDS